MLRPVDNYFLQNEEPIKSCMHSLRTFILSQDTHITEAWQYGMPFYYYRGKRFCYLWIHKKRRQPYLGIVEGKRVAHPDLLTENRAKMKILLIDPAKDIPVKKVREVLNLALALYK